ncbi:MAG TPA: hypothetical protein VGR41_09045 [Actinomycetota bacterium]|jgi:hypothetical protein|nr:hypothetical protein [Actinomycetota bacterium]
MPGVSENGFDVRISNVEALWNVVIVDPTGAEVSVRACRDGAEARTYASTVRQHIYWLSPDAFRAYYRIGG